jgi:hypothetical protein
MKMEINPGHPSRLKAFLQPKVLITLGSTAAFYLLVHTMEGTKPLAYPDEMMLPGTALISMCLLSMGLMWWFYSRTWSYYLLAHLFALGFGSAVFFMWMPFEYGPGGITSDSWFSSAILVKYKSTWANTDFAYKDLHSFYPSLYQYVVGKFAALTHTPAAKAMKYGFYWTAFWLPLGVYGLWRKTLAELPALLVVLFTMFSCRQTIAFKPFEVISLVLFIPWALHYVTGMRRREADGRSTWEFVLPTRKDILWGGLIGGLIFMTFYYYFFLFIVWLPLLVLVDVKEGRSMRDIWMRFRAFGLMMGVMLCITAVYWLPLLLDMVRYGAHSYQNRWFQPNMFALPWDIINSWRSMLGLLALVVLAHGNRLARAALVMTIAVIAFTCVGHISMYSGFPLLHFRMSIMDEYLLGLGFVLGILELARLVPGFLKSQWEKGLPLLFMVVLSMAIGMHFLWDKNSAEAQQSRNTSLPGLVTFPEFTALSKDKVFLTNRLELVAFRPLYLFICPNAHYNHPAARYRERLKFLVLLSKSRDADFVAWMLQHNRYDKVDFVILDDNQLSLWDDDYPEPQNHIRVPIEFQKDIFKGTYFQQDSQFVELKHLKPMPEDHWKLFTPEQVRLAALFAREDIPGLKQQVEEPALKSMQDEIRIRTRDYATWQRVFWHRWLGGF